MNLPDQSNTTIRNLVAKEKLKKAKTEFAAAMATGAIFVLGLIEYSDTHPLILRIAGLAAISFGISAAIDYHQSKKTHKQNEHTIT